MTHNPENPFSQAGRKAQMREEKKRQEELFLSLLAQEIEQHESKVVTNLAERAQQVLKWIPQVPELTARQVGIHQVRYVETQTRWQRLINDFTGKYVKEIVPIHINSWVMPPIDPPFAEIAMRTTTPSSRWNERRTLISIEAVISEDVVFYEVKVANGEREQKTVTQYKPLHLTRTNLDTDKLESYTEWIPEQVKKLTENYDYGDLDENQDAALLENSIDLHVGPYVDYTGVWFKDHTKAYNFYSDDFFTQSAPLLEQQLTQILEEVVIRLLTHQPQLKAILDRDSFANLREIAPDLVWNKY